MHPVILAALFLMPAPQQNALVQKYCAVCHTDKSNNGGLSLQHFDAAKAPPSLIAMVLSKMKSGAIGAAGNGIPEKPVIEAWTQAFATEAAGATDWNRERTAEQLSVSLFRETTMGTGERRAWRVITSCNLTTNVGSLQLAWSPQPANGTLTASIDGKPAVPYTVKGSEKMGNGSTVVTNGLAALELAPTLPAESLSIAGLFPNETATFPFATLPKETPPRPRALLSRHSPSQ